MSTNMKSVYGKAKDNYSFKIKLKSTILVVWFVILTIICLLPIYILIINATREHSEIANGLSFIPGSNLKANFHKIVTDQNFKLSYKVLITTEALYGASISTKSPFSSWASCFNINVYLSIRKYSSRYFIIFCPKS